MPFSINDRLKVGNEFCTVKFFGVIDPWPNVNTYGLEWDNPERGKHSGSIQGKEYFKTSKIGTGSFVKETKLLRTVQPRLTFSGALCSKYGDTLDSINDVSIGTKNWESIGFQKLTLKNNNIQSLKIVSLDNTLYSDSLKSSQDDNNFVKLHCQNFESLNLSCNLISNFTNVCNLIQNMMNLYKLNLSNNHFMVPSPDTFFKFENIKDINLASCNLFDSDLIHLLTCFSNVEKLNLSENNLTNDAFKTIEKNTNNLKLLIISNNNITEFPEIKKDKFPKLTHLDISHNKLNNFKIDEINNNLEILNISFNNIMSIDNLDILNEKFPKLLSIRCNGNPFMNNVDDDNNDTFLEIIARFNLIEVLNGSILDKNTRKDAELFFISQVLQNIKQYPKEKIRWRKLCDKYNVKTIKNIENSNIDSRSNRIMQISLRCDERSWSRDIFILKSFSVRYLKGIIHYHSNIPILDMQLSVIPNSNINFVIDREFSPLCDFDIQNKDTILITLKR